MSDFEGLIELGGAAAVEAAVLAGTKPQHCPNCGAEFSGPYCARCGQERDTHRRTLGKLLGDFFEDILSFDSRILRTARALVLEPGELTRAFREGRLQSYVPPIRLYFFVTLLFFLILSVSGIAILKLEVVPYDLSAQKLKEIQLKINTAVKKAKADVPKGTDLHTNVVVPHVGFHSHVQFFAPIDTNPKPLSPKEEKALKRMQADIALGRKLSHNSPTADWATTHVSRAMIAMAHNPTAINGPLTTWIPRALFLLLPIFALLLAIFHWRQREHYYFVDHLVFSLNVHSFAFVVLIAAVWLAQVASGGTVGWFALLAVGLYLFIAMKRFYRQGWAITVTKFAFLSFIYATFFLIPALGIIVAVSALEA